MVSTECIRKSSSLLLLQLASTKRKPWCMMLKKENASSIFPAVSGL
jgi:hypothetical protein